jgi:hypothetical protein
MANTSSLRRISLCRDDAGPWVCFTEVSPEGPDRVVYLPVNRILPMADAIDRVAERDDRKYLFVSCPIEGKDYWGKPARLHGVAYMVAAFRYRPGIIFKGRDGHWSAWFVSGRHARLVARLLRQIHRQHAPP